MLRRVSGRGNAANERANNGAPPIGRSTSCARDSTASSASARSSIPASSPGGSGPCRGWSPSKAFERRTVAEGQSALQSYGAPGRSQSPPQRLVAQRVVGRESVEALDQLQRQRRRRLRAADRLYHAGLPGGLGHIPP